VFGLSTQPTGYQREMAERLRLPFEIVSDESFALQRTLSLPTFVTGEVTYLKRLTLAVRDGRVERVYYPSSRRRACAGSVRLARHDPSHALKLTRPARASTSVIREGGDAMTPKVEYHFDFGSPNAYCVHKVIPAIEQRTGVRQQRPILLAALFKLTLNGPWAPGWFRASDNAAARSPS